MNPLAKIAASAASRASNAVNNAKNKANPEGNETSANRGSVASVALFNPFALKLGLILGLVAIIGVIILGGFFTLSNVTSNLSQDNCTRSSDQLSLVREIEESGTVLEDSDRESLLQQSDNPCGGVGYTGQTFPPTVGAMSSPFGPRVAPCPTCTPNHKGMDIAQSCGAPVYAFAGGTVTVVIQGSEALATSSSSAYPMGIIIIQHTEEFATAYYHTRESATFVKAGDVVSAGDLIGDQWSNGGSTGCHLHFEVRLNGKQIDPNDILLSYGYDYIAGITLENLPPVPVPEEAGTPINTSRYPTGSAQGIAESLMVSKSWSENEFNNCLVPLWREASRWSINYSNEQSGAYGIPAARPRSSLEASGSDWATNPRTQIVWGLDYIQRTYGNPCVAWTHMQQKNWY